MILLDSNDTPTPITNLADAKSMQGFWQYDLQRKDFFCSDLTAIVELQSSALTIAVNNNLIHLPVDWYTIVCDKMSGVIDTIKIHELTNTNFKLFVVGPKLHTITETGYQVVNFDHNRTFFYPTFLKHQMLCIAITPSKWIFLTPNDTYQKYIKHMSPSEFLL